VDRRLAIVAAIAFGIAMSTGNFFYFYVNREAAFQFHNAAALVVRI